MAVWYVLTLAVFGFVVGALARFAVPGPDPMRWWATMLFGVGGAFLGGLVSQIVFGVTGGFLMAFAGAFALVLGYRLLVQKRPITGPRARLRR